MIQQNELRNFLKVLFLDISLPHFPVFAVCVSLNQCSRRFWLIVSPPVSVSLFRSLSPNSYFPVPSIAICSAHFYFRVAMRFATSSTIVLCLIQVFVFLSNLLPSMDLSICLCATFSFSILVFLRVQVSEVYVIVGTMHWLNTFDFCLKVNTFLSLPNALHASWILLYTYFESSRWFFALSL